MNRFSILVADDHPIFRFGLCALLRSHLGWEICGEAADGRDAVQKCKQLKPDLLILDICMPELNGLEAARQVLKHNPDQAILVLTAVDSEDTIRECLEAGIRGWVFKSEATRDLMTAVEALQQQKTIFSSRVSEMIMDGYKRYRVTPVPDKLTRLSPREREVVQLVTEGKASKQIAAILSMSLSTAETHRSNILRKLRLHSIAELVLYAVRNGLVHVHLPPVVQGANLETKRFPRPATAGYLPPCRPGNGLSSIEAEGVN
jgi:DNA-binding NarL/FixJ family response regulator